MFEPMTDALREKMKEWTFQMVPELKEKLHHFKRPQNEYGVDPFGFNLDFALSAVAPFVWLYKNYFRVQVDGIQKVPDGRVLLCSNHSGQLPFDGGMIGVSLLIERDPPLAVRSMVEKWMPTLPFVSTIFARSGQVVGTPENCRRLLAEGEPILVFPEGVRGLNKMWPQRYQLQDFGLGFMRLALETDTPVVPVAVVGAEEQAPAIFDFKPMAKLLRFPSFPITPTVVPFPLPSRYYLYFGDPIKFTGSPNDEDAELEKKVKQVKAQVQSMINDGLKKRTSVFR